MSVPLTVSIEMLRESQAEAKRLREALEFSDPDRPSFSMDAPEDREVLLLCNRWGFGAVMHSACRQWLRRDPIGALMMGTTASQVRDALAKR